APLNAGLVRKLTGRLPRTADEVVVSTALLARTGTAVGEPLHLLEPERTLTIVGSAVLPDATKDHAILALPGAVSGQSGFSSYLIGLPAGVQSRDLVPAMNRAGWLITPRSTIAHPPFDTGMRSEQLGVALVVAGLALLEIILLAGAAFAVGARRQRRELGLVAATGGVPAQVRGVVLSSGVVLGLTAAIAAVVGGVAVAAALAPVFESRLSSHLFDTFEVRVPEVLGIALLALVTAVLAAVLPARAAARQPVVDALSGRRGVVRSPVRLTLAGIVAIVAGAAIAAKGAMSPVRFNQILAGAVMAELGFVVCSPALVGAAGRLAGVLPLPLRLAVRDCARHRNRSGPAVAAVMAALAGAVAMSVYLASDTERQREAYEPQARPGQVLVYMQPDRPFSPAEVDSVARELPASAVIPLLTVGPTCDNQGCKGTQAYVSVERPRDAALGCAEPECSQQIHAFSPVQVGDLQTVQAQAGRLPESAAKAIAAGAAAVLDPRLVVAGQVTIDVTAVDFSNSGEPAAEAPVRKYTLPAVVVGARERGDNVIVSAATATRLGLQTTTHAVLIDTHRAPTTDEQDRAEAVLLQRRLSGSVYVERGFHSDRGIALIALVSAAVLIALGASVIATGLSAADGRPDLATLAAVGASPSVRRFLAMSQAATIAFLGSVLGVLAGLVPSVAIINARTEFPVVIPWALLAVLVVAVPALIALFAGVFTRSRLPLDRRLA
ncbi:MAG: FtsX-like permease family protein, partial [Mycobacteriales bacterium]